MGSAPYGTREWAQIRNALAYYADEAHWDEDDWGVISVLVGQGYGRPHEKAKRAFQALRRLERAANAAQPEPVNQEQR